VRIDRWHMTTAQLLEPMRRPDHTPLAPAIRPSTTFKQARVAAISGLV